MIYEFHKALKYSLTRKNYYSMEPRVFMLSYGWLFLYTLTSTSKNDRFLIDLAKPDQNLPCEV